MKVYVLILPGNFGDMESFGGVFATLEAAMKAHPGKWKEGGTNLPGWWYIEGEHLSGEGAWIQEEEVKE